MATIRIRALIAVGCLLTCLACGSDSDATSESRSPSTAETAAGEPKSGDEAGNEADAEEDDGGLGDRTEADGTGPGTTTRGERSGGDGEDGPGSPATPPGPNAGEGPGVAETACDDLPAERVASVVGSSVEGWGPRIGTGSYQDVEFASRGCAYELSAGGEVEVVFLFDPGGAALDASGYDRLHTASTGRSGMSEHLHEEVAGIGDRAFFADSLASNSLVVDTGVGVMRIEGKLGDETIDRSTMEQLAGAHRAVAG